MANSFGKMFTITSFGESHGRCVGIVIDGCPAGLPLNEADIQKDVDRRKPQDNSISTPRKEPEQVEIISGVFNGYTTGAPLAMVIWNKDADSSSYEKIKDLPRPGHSDYPIRMKSGGFNDYRGGGRSSGRITAGFVMAGAVAKKLLASIGVEILAHSIAIGGIEAAPQTIESIRATSEGNLLRCADTSAVNKMMQAVEKARSEGDSLGGIIEGIALNLPAGLGGPVFDTLEGDLAKAVFAIPAVKGVEFGSGFAAASKKGSENNDGYRITDGIVTTSTNNAGGITGGMANGMPIILRAAVKPTPSISKKQQTVDLSTMTETDMEIGGRHDACIVPRAVPVVEAMMAVTLCDHVIRSGFIPEVIR